MHGLEMGRKRELLRINSIPSVWVDRRQDDSIEGVYTLDSALSIHRVLTS